MSDLDFNFQLPEISHTKIDTYVLFWIFSEFFCYISMIFSLKGIAWSLWSGLEEN